MAGYSGTPLLKKLGIKPDYKILFVNEPDHYQSLLGEFPEGVQLVSQTHPDLIDFIHVFCKIEEELHNLFPPLKEKLDKNGSIWVSWIKKASKNYEATFPESEVRTLGLNLGLVDVKVCAVDEDWSGLKFVYRIEDRK
ncbi:hypothetical protein A8B79_05000 [Balneola sp. EhC07]|uniref:DUF3052 family protein n=1 Tax=Balneola sp. EhC07 TaxID=1849360 RepID=UPI0007F3633E|nr:DUF3052 family protein [Balneola sp. EhC07]OAN61784.1 hypothetical protein A8B79_05000 [Balneola sp. EhC07]